MMFENRKEGVGWFPDCHSHKEHSSSAARTYLLARREHPSLHAAGFFTPKLAAAAMGRNFGAATTPMMLKFLSVGAMAGSSCSRTDKPYQMEGTRNGNGIKPATVLLPPRRTGKMRYATKQSYLQSLRCPRRQRHLRRLWARGFGNSNHFEASRAGLLFGLRQSGSGHLRSGRGDNGLGGGPAF